MALEFVKSEKNKLKLVTGGFLYVKDKQNNNKIYWKCKNFKKLSCNCRVTTLNGEFYKIFSEHNHAGDSAKIEATKINNKIRNNAIHTRDAPHYTLDTMYQVFP